MSLKHGSGVGRTWDPDEAVLMEKVDDHGKVTLCLTRVAAQHMST